MKSTARVGGSPDEINDHVSGNKANLQTTLTVVLPDEGKVSSDLLAKYTLCRNKCLPAFQRYISRGNRSGAQLHSDTMTTPSYGTNDDDDDE